MVLKVHVNGQTYRGINLTNVRHLDDLYRILHSFYNNPEACGYIKASPDNRELFESLVRYMTDFTDGQKKRFVQYGQILLHKRVCSACIISASGKMFMYCFEICQVNDCN
jgi:hypothetical protein